MFAGKCPDLRKTEPPATPECPLTDIDARHATYEALLGQLSLASDHQENLLSRGLSLEMIQELGYKTTPVIGMTAIAKHLQEAGYYLSGFPDFTVRMANGALSVKAGDTDSRKRYERTYTGTSDPQG